MKRSYGKLVAVAISSLICTTSAANAEKIAAEDKNDCAVHKSAAERQVCRGVALDPHDTQHRLQMIAMNMAMNDAVAAEPEMVWTSGRYDDGPDPVALLRYGIPETDAIGFEATCEKSGGSSAKTIFWYATDHFSEGQDVVLEISGEDYDKKLPAKIYGTELEVGVSGIRIDLPLDAPIWQSLRRGTDLIYRAVGTRPEKLQLEGAAKAVGKFIADCKAIAAGDSKQAAPPETDILAESFVCEDGTTFEARFDNSRSYSVALLALDGDPEIALIQGPSGSGVRYSNGDTTLHTKGDDALLMRGEETRRCRAK